MEELFSPSTDLEIIRPLKVGFVFCPDNSVGVTFDVGYTEGEKLKLG